MRIAWIVGVVALPLTLAGCSDPKAEELEDIGADMSKFTSQCLNDVQSVPIEHSMHCIEIAKRAFPVFSKRQPDFDLFFHCRGSQTDACADYWFVLSRTQGLYWRAVAQSVANFGMPQNWDKKVAAYQMSDELEPHFATCLEEHPNPEKPEWLAKLESKPSDPKKLVPIQEPLNLDNPHCIGIGMNEPLKH